MLCVMMGGCVDYCNFMALAGLADGPGAGCSPKICPAHIWTPCQWLRI